MGFRIDSESILYSKESILFTILWPKMVILNRFGIVGNQNRLSPSSLPRSFACLSQRALTPARVREEGRRPRLAACSDSVSEATEPFLARTCTVSSFLCL